MTTNYRRFPNNGLLLFISAIALSFLGTSCAPSLQQVRIEQLTKRVEMTKGPCYGRCPVYTLRIYDNGIATYKGDRYTDRMGLYVKQLPMEEATAIFNKFNEANIWQFKSVYKSDIPDFQTVSITFIDEGDFKTVTGKDGRPDEVMELEFLLDRVASNKLGWIQKEGPTKSPLPQDAVPNEIIVQLSPDLDTRAWVKKYKKQKYRLVRKISTSRTGLDYWLSTFDDSSIAPLEMLEKLRKDGSVNGAEFNIRATARK
ncbi:MAG: DUF6438 domain-containing protein [Bacteroidota bacterium]